MTEESLFAQANMTATQRQLLAAVQQMIEADRLFREAKQTFDELSSSKNGKKSMAKGYDWPTMPGLPGQSDVPKSAKHKAKRTAKRTLRSLAPTTTSPALFGGVTQQLGTTNYSLEDRNKIVTAYDRLPTVSQKSDMLKFYHLQSRDIWRWRTKPTAKPRRAKNTSSKWKWKSKPADPAEEAIFVAEVYQCVSANPWHTKTSLIAKTGKDFYRVTRALGQLSAEGKIKQVRKSGNPRSQTPNAPYNYWEAV